MTAFARACIVTVAFMAIGCNKADPLDGLSSDDKTYLFAGSGTNVPFLGQSVDAGPLNCYPQRMNQGYVLVDTVDSLWLDSIRPSGVERHKILAVAATSDGYTIKAKNGVGVTFNLVIERKEKDLAMISWDGAAGEIYRRCPIVGG